MMGNSAILYIFLVLTGLAASGIVLTRNLIYAAFLLVLVFLGAAGLFVLANAGFVAVTQILVYVGGVLILLVFGIMLTNRIAGEPVNTPVSRLLAGLALSGALFFGLSQVISEFDVKKNTIADNSSLSVNDLGMSLLTDYLLIFELVGLLLLVALIGAATVARFREEANG